jgi:hypothetical protein
MRRIENMKTMSINRAALVLAAWNPSSVRTVRPATRLQPVASGGAAIEEQLDEIQRTFGARWEW